MRNTKNKIITFLVIGATLILAGIAVFTAIRLYNLRNQPVAPNVPESKPEAYTGQISRHDSCNLVKIEVIESTQCPQLSQTGNQECPLNGQTNNVTSYSTTYRITSNDGRSHSISWKTADEFCPEACGRYNPAFGGVFGCTNPELSRYVEKTEQVTPSQPLDIVVSRSLDETPYGQYGVACGTWQQDLWIDSIDGTARCNFKTSDNNVGAWGQCQTGVDCPTGTLPPPTTPPTNPTEPPAIDNQCTELRFSLTSPSVSPTPTEVATPKPTPTGTSVATPTVTATPTTPPTSAPVSCNNTCTTTDDCEGSLTCVSGVCRNPSCTAETDCVCDVVSAPQVTNPPALPNAGVGTPTIISIGAGILLLVVSLALAL